MPIHKVKKKKLVNNLNLSSNPYSMNDEKKVKRERADNESSKV